MNPTHLVRAEIVGHQSMQTCAGRCADPLYLALRDELVYTVKGAVCTLPIAALRAV